MDEKTEKLWKTILGEIETEVSRANFLTLFKNTALLSLVDNIATIAVPSAMIMNLLRKRYQETIKKALEKHTKENIKMVFVPKSLPSSPRAEVKDTPLFAEPEKKITPRIARLRADYTFQTLAVSDSNRLAFESARTITKNLGQSYNPLFIYGPVGVGKTHLMQAIANDVFEKTPEKKNYLHHQRRVY